MLQTDQKIQPTPIHYRLPNYRTPLLFLLIILIIPYLLLQFFYLHTKTQPPSEIESTIIIQRLLGGNNHYQGGYGILKQEMPNYWMNHSSHVYFGGQLKNSNLKKGEHIRIRGVLKDLMYHQSLLKPFDHYLLQSGIRYKVEHCVLQKKIKESSLLEKFYLKTSLILEEILSRTHTQEKPQQLNIYIAMLLGKKTTLSTQQKKDFIESGTMHLFAISGLHIGIIALAISIAIRLLNINGWLHAAIVITFLYIYINIIGYTPSAQRAFWMVVFTYAATICKRQSGLWQGCIASFIWILLSKPLDTLTLGFQLSYSAVAGISLFGIPLSIIFIEKYCRNPHQWTQKESFWTYWKYRMLHTAIRTIIITISATLLCTPLCIQYFKIITLGGILTNIIIIFLATIVIVGGMISWSLFWVPSASALINTIICRVINCMEILTHWINSVPGAHSYLAWKYEFAGKSLTLLTVIYLVLLQQDDKRRTQIKYYLGVIIVYWIIINKGTIPVK